MDSSLRFDSSLRVDSSLIVDSSLRVDLSLRVDSSLRIASSRFVNPSPSLLSLLPFCTGGRSADGASIKLDGERTLLPLSLSGEREDVTDILISLAQRETNNMSATFADMLVISMEKKGVPLLPNSHRFAGFAVLKAPDIPSVLIETGFMSNRQEDIL